MPMPTGALKEADETVKGFYWGYNGFIWGLLRMKVVRNFVVGTYCLGMWVCAFRFYGFGFRAEGLRFRR